MEGDKMSWYPSEGSRKGSRKVPSDGEGDKMSWLVPLSRRRLRQMPTLPGRKYPKSSSIRRALLLVIRKCPKMNILVHIFGS